MQKSLEFIPGLCSGGAFSPFCALCRKKPCYNDDVVPISCELGIVDGFVALDCKWFTVTKFLAEGFNRS